MIFTSKRNENEKSNMQEFIPQLKSGGFEC
jgi:hypothetical protein